MRKRHPSRSSAVVIVAAASVLALPSQAAATTVSRFISEGLSGAVVSVQDTTGVLDHLVVTGSRSGPVTVTSTAPPRGTARPITAGSGCTQSTATVVTCPDGVHLSATLAAISDTLINRSDLTNNIQGGDGNDRLTSGIAGGTLTGGLGNDTLINAESAAAGGNARTVRLVGQDGADTFDMSGNRAGGDIAEGGAGVDTATYARRLDGRVDVSLDGTANDGATEFVFPDGVQSVERDNVRTDVENLRGGGLNDSLTGSAAGNELSGNAGNDTLQGLAGSDVLMGGDGNDLERGGDGGDTVGARSAADAAVQDPGEDSLFGQGGFDTLHAADGISDAVIDCGPGEVEGVGELATIDLTPDEPEPISCERVQEGAKDQHPLVQVRGSSGRLKRGRVIVRLACPKAAPGDRCKGSVEVLRRGRAVAKGRYRVRAGKARRLKLRLRRRGTGRAEVVTHELDTMGRPETTRTRIRLRR